MNTFLIHALIKSPSQGLNLWSYIVLIVMAVCWLSWHYTGCHGTILVVIPIAQVQTKS